MKNKDKRIVWHIESWDINKLTPYEKNPRIITDAGLKQLEDSFDECGYAQPININIDGTILSGHARWMQLKKENAETVDVYVPDRKLTPKQEEAVIVRMNKNVAGTWDMDKLIKEFQVDDLLNWGFDESDLNLPTIEELDPKCGEDEVPEVAAIPKTKRGDVWILGNHRLMCGDSTMIDEVEKLMNGEKADMVFTDPPYNADYSSRVDKTRGKPWGGILNDSMTSEAFEAFLIDINSVVWAVIKTGSSVYECIDWKRYPQLAKVFSEAFLQKSMIVWNKNCFGLGTYYRTKHELILFGCKGEKLNTWNGEHNEMDVWDISREKLSSYEHPTQKPVSIPERAIVNSSKEKDIVLDLFGGSGSTLIACEKNKRLNLSMELDPKYCDVIIKRWQKYTGKRAVHENGQLFDEMI